MSVAEPHVQSILLGDAIEHAPAAVLVADDDGRYVAVNAYACTLLGYDRTELLAMHAADVTGDAAADGELTQPLNPRSLTGTSVARRKDGTRFAFVHRAGETKIAGMTYYVVVGWPAE
jgi:PAS domain S-box-containing protein